MYQNFFKSLKEHTGILIRFDDIAPNMNWKMMDKCERLLNEYKIKPVIGVIPNNQDPELMAYEKRDKFWQIIKNWKKKNWEIAMHGYTHVYDTETNKRDYFKYGGKSEFFGHSFKEQLSRLVKGKKIFDQNNIVINTFFAPNHTYDFNTFSNGLTPFVGFGIGQADMDNATDDETIMSLTAGARYSINEKAYVGAKVSFMEIDGPDDGLGIQYEDIELTSFEVVVGTSF